MKRISIGKALGIGVVLGAAGLGAAVAACSSNSSSSGGTGPGSGDSGVSTQPASCASSTLAITFSPMYSAFIPGSTAHQFQIPVVVQGANGNVTWGASDPSKVNMTPDPTSGGVMLTVNGTGNVDIIATDSSGACGKSTLNVTTAADSDWQIGNARYNDGNSLRFGPGGSDAGQTTPDAGPACTNCHGPTAMNGIFNDVSHTPEQTGGFSDQDLIDIVVNGVVPDGGYFDPNVIIPDSGSDPDAAARAYRIWQSFHKWSDIGPDQQKGMVVYLRSLTPAPQDGTSNFGGRHRDGGFGDGGHHRDGGFGEGGPNPPPPDAAGD